jgi:hypothetical protein
MKKPGLICALVLASFATVAAQAPTISARRISLVVVENTSFESVVKVMGALGGVTIEFDESVPMELRNRSVDRIHFEDTELESALQFLTKFNNLIFRAITPTFIRIELKESVARD